MVSSQCDEKDSLNKIESEMKKSKRLDEAMSIFHYLILGFIPSILADAGYNKNINNYDPDPIYIEFVKCAVGSELNRIHHIMRSIPQYSMIDACDCEHIIIKRDCNFEMMQKALTMFQVKICSILKQSMMQAKFRSYETYECNYNYITFARTALQAELNRVSHFEVQSVGSSSSAVDHNTAVPKKPSASSLTSLSSEHTSEDRDGPNTSIAISTHASDSTRLMGSLTGRKRFFEQFSDEENSERGNSPTNQKKVRIQSSAPVILNPYYYQQPFSNVETK